MRTTHALDSIEQVESSFTSQVYDMPFIFDVGPRFNTMTRGELEALSSIEELLPEDKLHLIKSYMEVGVNVLDKRGKLTNNGSSSTSPEFDHAQLLILRTSELSSDIMFEARCKEVIPHSGQVKENYYTPHYTLVPEQQASYPGGKEALIAYIHDAMEQMTAAVDRQMLRSGQVRFTVGTDGRVRNITLLNSCYYPDIDKKILELLPKAPGAWVPALDAQGRTVEQELILFFGMMGC